MIRKGNTQADPLIGLFVRSSVGHYKGTRTQTIEFIYYISTTIYCKSCEIYWQAINKLGLIKTLENHVIFNHVGFTSGVTLACNSFFLHEFIHDKKIFLPTKEKQPI